MRLKTLPVIAALLLPSLPPLPAGAQARLMEISAYGEGGLSTLYYSLPDIARRSNALGGGGGLGYAFFFTDQLSLHTGAGLTLYRAQAKLSDGFGTITATLDDYYEPAELRSTFSRHAERQTALMLRLPLQGQWQSKVKSRSRGHRFYVR
ncbi:MAG: hypothetical protein LBK18_10085, partial [Prevotellaceae bacterium]|nr:hypothetical protein [Prevotellaceae bacterium]